MSSFPSDGSGVVLFPGGVLPDVFPARPEPSPLLAPGAAGAPGAARRCSCSECQDRRVLGLDAGPCARVARVDRLAVRAAHLERTGLSNPPYFHAENADADSRRGCGGGKTPAWSAGPYAPARAADLTLTVRDVLHADGYSAQHAVWHAPASVRVSVTPSRIRVRVGDQFGDNSGTPLGASGSKRGVISTLSDAARDRMTDTAVCLGEMGREADLMLTFTSPANWKDVYLVEPELDENGKETTKTGGKLFKQHMEAMRMRLERFFKARKLGKPRVFWFLEFQKRGAPHVHMILFDVGAGLSELAVSLREWVGPAWAEIVGNPCDIEQAKHARAGTRVEKMRVKHFGYAVKYGSKTEQKIVPEEFRHVGRFWGMWNYKLPKAVVMSFDFTHGNVNEANNIKRLMVPAIGTVAKHSPSFVATTLGKLQYALDKGIKTAFGFSIFGAAAGKAVCAQLGIDWELICRT